MKKLLFVVLAVALVSFLFVGCFPTVTPDDDSEVAVVIEDAYVDADGKTYVSAGSHDITVTFPAPIAGVVVANITACTGDLTKKELVDMPVVLFPDATRKIWAGSGEFTQDKVYCCASYLEVTAGECDASTCIAIPVIVDGLEPAALIAISVDDCSCDGCEVSFESYLDEDECGDELCCGDSCSGLASWAINVYEDDPFDSCCDPSICEDPVYTCTGTDCPIECTTTCLEAGTYTAIVELVDNVGLTATYYAQIVVNDDDGCAIEVKEGTELSSDPCVEWDSETTDTIGTCDVVVAVI